MSDLVYWALTALGFAIFLFSVVIMAVYCSAVLLTLLDWARAGFKVPRPPL